MELFYFEHISIKISIDGIYLFSIYRFVAWSMYMLFILIVLQGKALIAHLWTYIVTWDYPLRANFFGDKNGTLSNPWYYMVL